MSFPAPNRFLQSSISSPSVLSRLLVFGCVGASIEPSNKDLKTLAEAAAKGPVINNKYTIGDEKKWNVFVRLGVEEVKYVPPSPVIFPSWPSFSSME
jgi:hypothetical protein